MNRKKRLDVMLRYAPNQSDAKLFSINSERGEISFASVVKRLVEEVNRLSVAKRNNLYIDYVRYYEEKSFPESVYEESIFIGKDNRFVKNRLEFSETFVPDISRRNFYRVLRRYRSGIEQIKADIALRYPSSEWGDSIPLIGALRMFFGIYKQSR